MFEIEDNKSVIVRLLRTDTHTVATSSSGSILGINADIHCAVVGGKQAFGLGL